MEVGVRVLRHVEVEDHVDLFNVNASAEDVGADHDPVLELLELFVSLDSALQLLLTFLPVTSLCAQIWRENSPSSTTRQV